MARRGGHLTLVDPSAEPAAADAPDEPGKLGTVPNIGKLAEARAIRSISDAMYDAAQSMPPGKVATEVEEWGRKLAAAAYVFEVEGWPLAAARIAQLRPRS